MNRGVIILGIGMFFVFIAPSVSWGHPHVFAHTAVDVVFDDKGLAGFRIRWVFDEMFSSMITMEFDRNGNRRFEPSEVAEVEAGAFSNLKSFGYFTHITINRKPFDVVYVTDFNAEIKGDKMLYTFFVPCHVSAGSGFKRLGLSIYDPEFYCSIFLIKDPVSYENEEGLDISYKIEENPEKVYYFGQIIPREIVLRFRKKK